jgi:hypothetical protein
MDHHYNFLVIGTPGIEFLYSCNRNFIRQIKINSLSKGRDKM